MVSHEGLRSEYVNPLFLSLCKVAISHFKNSVDRESAIFLTASPTPWVAGSTPANIERRVDGLPSPADRLAHLFGHHLKRFDFSLRHILRP